MAEDKVIKSGQLTLKRLIFLAACGAVLFVVVYFGLLIYGYILLTLVLCGLLLLVALDWGVALDKVDLTGGSAQVAAAGGGGAQILDQSGATAAARAQIARKKGSRQTKRRR